MKLTDEQKSLVEKNMRLVDFVLNKKCGEIPESEYEDIHQIGMVGLCKAAGNFKPEYGYTFATFAIKCITNEVYMTLRNPKLKRQRKVLSLDELIRIDDSGDDISLFDILPHIEDTESRLGLLLLTEMLDNKLSDRDRQIIKMRLQGVNQSKIGEHFGVTQSYISRLIGKIRNIIREEHGVGRFQSAS